MHARMQPFGNRGCELVFVELCSIKKMNIKSHYTRLIPFRVSRVSAWAVHISAALRQEPSCPALHFKIAAVTSRWQRWNIDQLGI